MKKTYRFLIFTAIVLIGFLWQSKAMAQVSIINAHLNSFNVTASSICEVSIMNYQAEVQVVFEAQVLNSANEPLLRVQSLPFMLAPGLNTLSSTNIPISTTEFGTSAQATNIQTMHMLPSGRFQYCCKVQVLSSEGGDEYCEDIESDLNSDMFLLYPDDKDTIETKTPVLMWMHSEPFNLVATGEYFRMIVVELATDQNAENGVMVNNPVFEKDGLTSHSEQYPIDALALKEGSRYGWQVQRVTNGVVTNKTEAWEFIVKPPVHITENKYAMLKKTLDSGFYTVENDKIFFRFDEEYIGGKISCALYNSKREKMLPAPANEDKALTEISAKKNGTNYYVINLDELSNITSGFYTLEVKNEKGELFLLKCYVQ